MTLLLLLACVDTPPDTGTDGTTVEQVEDTAAAPTLFDPERVLEVAIELDPEAWDALRFTGRSFYSELAGDCLAAPFESPYDWVGATVTLDGAARGARIRKKGFIGSLDVRRPSLRVDLGEDGYGGVAEFNLNAAPQDPTHLRTCLAYAAYRTAGVPAPACSFAHVRVNGSELGVYAVVERVDEAFAERAFGPGGALFEGTLSDLREGWTGTFDPDSAGADPETLAPLVAALRAPDADLHTALAPVLDLDAFHAFWAAEVLVGQWDGYAANANNYYVHVGADGRARFIPWGPDAAFGSDAPFGPDAPRWIAAQTQLPWRLARTATGLARHQEAVKATLATWDRDAMLAELERMADAVAPWSDVSGTDRRDLASVVRTTEDTLRASLRDDPYLPAAALGAPPCLARIGTIRAPFVTTWESLATQDAGAYGAATLSFEWAGERFDLEGTCVTGVDESGLAAIVQVAPAGEATLVPYLQLPPSAVAPGTRPVDGHGAAGVLYYADPSTRGRFVVAAYLGGGTLRLDAAGSASGEEIRGELTTDLWVFGN